MVEIVCEASLGEGMDSGWRRGMSKRKIKKRSEGRVEKSRGRSRGFEGRVEIRVGKRVRSMKMELGNNILVRLQGRHDLTLHALSNESLEEINERSSSQSSVSVELFLDAVF